MFTLTRYLGNAYVADRKTTSSEQGSRRHKRSLPAQSTQENFTLGVNVYHRGQKPLAGLQPEDSQRVYLRNA